MKEGSWMLGLIDVLGRQTLAIHLKRKFNSTNVLQTLPT